MTRTLAILFFILILLLPVTVYAGSGLLDRWSWGGDGWCPLVSSSGWDGTLSRPVPTVDVHPERWFAGEFHRGIDLNVPIGTPVTAAASGVVVWDGESTVIVAHGQGWMTLYAHLSRIDVTCGQRVGRGDVIGLSGQMRTTFPHLHLGLWRDGEPVDPAPLLGLVTPTLPEPVPNVMTRAGGGERRGQR